MPENWYFRELQLDFCRDCWASAEALCCCAGVKKSEQSFNAIYSCNITGSDLLISVVSVVSAIFIGGMNWAVALHFAAGALAGMLVGQIFAHFLAGPKLQQGFAVVSMGVSVWMVVRLFWMSNG